MVRATVQRELVFLVPYENGLVNPQSNEKTRGQFATCLFGQSDEPIELPNIKSFEWSRSVNQEIAEATLTLYNTEVLPMGATPDSTDGYELPGFFTYRHGVNDAGTRWSQATNGWRDVLVPDRVVKTWEGYGFDNSSGPENDEHMYPSGVWLIDKVKYTTDATIVLTLRDVGRLLEEQICFPPVVPWESYPLFFSGFHNVKNPKVTTSTSDWFRPNYDTDSNIPYIGYGFSDGPGRNYVESDGSINGHYGKHAFDNSEGTYWMSVGNYAGWSSAFEYVQGRFSARDVGAVRFRPWAGPYKVFISVRDSSGDWKGKKKIPYRARAVNTNADIPFVKAVTVKKGDTKTVKLPKVYKDINRVRLTFTDLYDSGIGQFRYRAGCRMVEVSGSATESVDGGTHVEGNYGDWTQVVKWLLAWGGYYWPRADSPAGAEIINSDGTTTTLAPVADDPDIATSVGGRVWGDFENANNKGESDLTIDIFDKKPLLDGILYVRDILNFMFFTDETGAAVWRSPNIWKVGNYISPLTGGPTAGRTTDVIEINDELVISEMSSELSSANIREKIFVANSTGQFGAVVNGINPYPAGIRRVAGWCVDTETEIFTQRGWLRWDEVKAGDSTLALTAEGQAAWEEIREVATFDAEPRRMAQLRSSNFSALTTPEHRWLVERYDSAKRRYERKWVTSESLTNMDRVARSASGGAAAVPTVSDDLVELVAWTYTEGTIKRSARSIRDSIVLYQSETANPENTERIRALLQRLFGRVSESTRRGAVEWRIGVEDSEIALRFLGADKAPTMDFLLSLTEEQLKLFIEVSVLADGYHRKDGARFFYQAVGPRLDAFLAACSLAGQAVSYHVVDPDESRNDYSMVPKATVTLLRSDYANFSNGRCNAEFVDYDDIVWCPSLNEHHTWLARRAGSVYFTGNTDTHFKTEAECRVMADLIAVRSMFTYRTNSITIPGNPAIQIDDQVRIAERLTADTFLHYVQSISSSFDMETRVWKYDLETFWLGEEPFADWVFDPATLSPETKQYLELLGKI